MSTASDEIIDNEKLRSRIALLETELVEITAHLDSLVIEQKRSMAALRESEERFRTIAKATSDAIWDWNIQTNAVWWNEGISNIFGHARDNVGQDVTWWYENIHEDDRQQTMEDIHRVIDQGEEYWEHEYRYRRGDGSYAHVLDRGYTLQDETGKTVRMVGGMQDMTEQYQAREAIKHAHDLMEQRVDERTTELARSRSFLRMVIDTVADPIFVKDREHRWIEGNRAFFDLIGLPEQDILGKSDYDIFPKEQADQFWAGDEQVYAHAAPYDAEERIKRANGSIRLIATRKVPFLMADGQLGLVGVIRDITEQRQMEEERQQHLSDRQFREMADAIPQLAWMADETGAVFWYNQGWYNYTGLPPDQDGWSWQKAHDPNILPEVIKQWEASLRTGERFEMTFPLRGADGVFRPFLTRSNPMRDQYGNIVRWFGTNTDITKQQQTESDLTDAKERAEEASIAKSDFLANMSHEIRTPLNAVVGIASLLERGGIPESKLPQFHQTLRSSADSLLELINDLLDISKIEQRDFQLARERFAFDELITDVINMLSQRAREKNISLMADLDAVRGLYYDCDKNRLRQVLVNIIGNAIKFTQRGAVTVRVLRVPQMVDCSGIEIQVIDSGIGIPEEMLGKLFQKFVRGHNVGTIGGTGLGLAITKHLVEMMEGTLHIESTEGFGTRVHLCLPDTLSGRALPRAAATSPAPHPIFHTTKKVLLVEDLPTNIAVATAILDDMKLTHDIAQNGKEALEMLERTTYGLVLMDVNMPEVDGLSATREWRGHEARHGQDRLPIIALTAHALAGDRDRCLAAGMDDFLAKPVTAEALFEMIARHMKSN